MQRYFLLLIVLSLSTSVFAQKNKKIKVHELDQIKGLFYQVNTIDPFTGIAFDEHSNGKKKLQIPIKAGKINGTAMEWTMSGDKTYEATFENGVQVGTETQWYASGQKKLEINYVNGLSDGICTEWHKNGKKLSEGLFRNGKEEGEHNWWFSTGKPDQQIIYKNGLAEGLVKNWYENGQLKLGSNYQNGKKQGLTTKWHHSGQKKSEEYFEEGEQDGKAQFWSNKGIIQGIRIHENGKLIEDINYRNGNINIGNGYLQVFNEAESFFTVPVTGNKVKAPESQDVITYVVDGMLLQVSNVSSRQFVKASTHEMNEEELLMAYKDYEGSFIKEAEPEFQYVFQTEMMTRPDGKKVLHWYFKSSSSLDEKQKPRTVQEEHYFSMVCNKQVLSMYSAITNSDEPKKVIDMLKRITENITVYEDRIDLNRLAADVLLKEK